MTTTPASTRPCLADDIDTRLRRAVAPFAGRRGRPADAQADLDALYAVTNLLHRHRDLCPTATTAIDAAFAVLGSWAERRVWSRLVDATVTNQQVRWILLAVGEPWMIEQHRVDVAMLHADLLAGQRRPTVELMERITLRHVQRSLTDPDNTSIPAAFHLPPVAELDALRSSARPGDYLRRATWLADLRDACQLTDRFATRPAATRILLTLLDDTDYGEPIDLGLLADTPARLA